MTIKLEKVKKDDIICVQRYMKVKEVLHDEVRGCDLDNPDLKDLGLKGENLIKASVSSDQWNEYREVTRSEIIETLKKSYNTIINAKFLTKDGEERSIRCRLLGEDVGFGRSNVEDIDLPIGEHRLRQIDHRTIFELCVLGVKYEVKGGKKAVQPKKKKVDIEPIAQLIHEKLNTPLGKCREVAKALADVL